MDRQQRRDLGRLLAALGALAIICGYATTLVRGGGGPAVPVAVLTGIALVIGGGLVWTDLGR